NQGAFTGNNGPEVAIDVEAPAGTVAGVTITGGVSTVPGASVFNNTALTREASLVEPSGTNDHFFVGSFPNPAAGTSPNPPALMPAGTPFIVTLAKAGGGTVSYTVQSNSFTTERISITNPTGSTLADAHL